MAKHRKTRREKMVADQRHTLYHLETKSAQVESSVGKKTDSTSLEPVPTRSKPATSYAYVLTDVKKTTLLTSAIIIGQLFLFLFLTRI